jgi:hypothetical protein
MNPCHVCDIELLARAWLIPAHPIATAINPDNVPYLMKFSFSAIALMPVPTFNRRAAFQRE